MGIENQPRMPASQNENWDMSSALAQIGIIEQQIRATGAVDEEPSMLARIRSQVINSEITPAQGVAEARKIEAGRNDYH